MRLRPNQNFPFGLAPREAENSRTKTLKVGWFYLLGAKDIQAPIVTPFVAFRAMPSPSVFGSQSIRADP